MWFLILLTALIIAFIFFYMDRLRTRTIEMLKEQLEKKAHESAREILHQKRDKEKLAERILSLKDELTEASEKAEQAEQAKNAFLSAMSYELRTPMNGLIGMTSLLSETQMNSEQLEYTETIRNCGERLLTVMNDLVDFSRIESDKVILDRNQFNLGNCIKEVLDIFEKKAAENDLKLTYQLEKNVPLHIIGDQLRLQQVLINLISNSIKFAQKGESISVLVHRIKNEGSQCTLGFEITDTGIGIPQDKAISMFKAFSFVDYSTTSKFGGTGLGLANTERLVRLMGGSISMESRRGEGATFSFSIETQIVKGQQVDEPLNVIKPIDNGIPETTVATNNKDEAVVAKNPNQKLPSDFSRQYPLSILIAEDNLVNQKLMERVLDKLGYRTEIVVNGNQVLDMVKKNHYDLILMDVQMPDMNGLETTRQIRQLAGPQPVIVAMTANAMQGDREECLQAGMNDYISKPVKFETLVDLLIKWYTQIHSDY